MPTEFINTLKTSAGDYSLPSTWDTDTQSDLTLATTKVFTHGGITGVIANNASVTGSISGATGTVVGVTTATQILVDGITGTFQSAENIEVDGSNFVTSSDAGDSAIAVLECDAGTYADRCNVSGWVSNATNYPIVRSAAGVLKGVPGQGVVFQFTQSFGGVAAMNALYGIMDGIEADNTSAGASAHGFQQFADYFYLRNCIGSSGAGANSSSFVLNQPSATNYSTAYNCLALTATGYAFSIGNYFNGEVSNCTATSGSIGFYKASTGQNTDVSNCVSVGTTTSDFDLTGVVLLNNASEDATATGTGAVTGISVTDGVDFVSPSTNNYRPTETGLLFGAGTDLSVDFTTDIRGETFVEWSIGAFDTPYVLRTLKASLGDYTLLSTWESSEQTSLTTSGDQHILECYADWPTGLFSNTIISGWGTSTTYFVTIKTPTSERHNQTKDNGFFMLGSSFNGTVIATSGTRVIFDGIAFKGDTSTGKLLDIGNSSSEMHNCFLYGGTSAYNGAVGVKVAINCLFEDIPNVALSGPWSQTSALSNCTIINCGTGLASSNSSTSFPTVVKNCVVYNCTTDTSDAGQGFVGSEYNATSSVSIGDLGTSGVTSVVDADFVDYAGDNYRPIETGVLFGAGIDLSGTFTKDIRGETFVEWSIGAFDTPWVLRTLKASLGDYTLMSTWESTEQTDLVASGDRHILECDAFTCNDGKVNVTGWTTGASNYITIKAAAGQEHHGVFGAGFILAGSTGSQGLLRIAGDYTEVYDIEIANTATTSTASALEIGFASNCIFKDLLFNGSSNGYYGDQWTAGSWDSNKLINCIAKDCLTGNGNGFLLNRKSAAYNCTAINCLSGFWGASNDSGYYNCVSFGTTNDDFGANTLASNNASEDATAPGAGSVTSITSAAFVDYAGGNYRPIETGVLFGAGTDLSGSFTTDIRGETYAEWSIGSFDTPYILRTLKSSLGDYSLISTWESTEQTDLVASGDTHILECYNFALSDAVAIGGWTTDASYFPIVRAATGEGCDGVVDAGFRISGFGGNGVFTVQQDYTVAENIQVTNTNSNTASGSFYLSAICTINRCIAKIDGNVTPGFTNSAGGIEINNSLAVNGTGVGFRLASNDITLNNCTSETSISTNNSSATDRRANNCYASSFGNMGAATDCKNNASNGTTAPGINPIDNVSTVDGVDFVSPSTNDYTPTGGGVLADAGFDLSPDLTVDITGATRTVPYDIGAYIAAVAVLANTSVVNGVLNPNKIIGTVDVNLSRVLGISWV